MNKIFIALLCCVVLVGCGGSEVKKEVEKKEVENKEEKKRVSTNAEKYKKIVAEFDLVGRWKASWTGPKNIYELYEKERKYKLVRFLMNYEPEIFDYSKKGDKYCDVKFDCTDYFKIVEGNLQYWNDAIGGHQKNQTYMVID